MSTGSPPTEYFPKINFNFTFWNSGKDLVTKEYVDNNFLKCVGYAYSRAISTSFNGIIYALGGIETTTIKASGDISANTFTGSGASLSSLNASNISSGTLTVARGGTGLGSLPLNQILIGNNTSSIFSTSLLAWDPATDSLNGKFVGSGAGLSNLNADNFINGVLDITFGGTGVNSLIADRLLIGGTTAISQSGNLTWTTATNILTASNFSGDGSRLTNLNSSNMSSGTLAVSRGGTGASTFTAGRLLIGNSTSAITEDPELTWNGTTNILTVSGTGAITTVSATNIGIGITNPTTSSIEIVRPVTTATDIINMRYDATNGLRFQQAYVAANDVKYNIIQKANNVDINALTYYKGNVGIGNTAPAATDKLSVTGNTKITGTATIDTNLVVGGTSQFTGFMTAQTGISISTGSLTLAGATTMSAGGLISANGGIQASTIKIGGGGLLKMATSTADFTQIGTTDSLLGVATCISLCGYTHPTRPSCILYTTEQTGKHIFFTTSGGFTNEKMRIENNGNVGIGTTNPLALLDLVRTGTYQVPTDLLNMRYDDNWGLKLQQNYTTASNIQYDFIHRYNAVNYNSLTFKGANVGIGNTAPTGTLCLGTSQIGGSDGFLLIGKNNGGGGSRSQRIGYNSNFDLAIGDYGGGTGPWIEAFKLSYAAPVNSLVISGAGNISTPYNINAGSITTAGLYTYNGSAGATAFNLAGNDGYAELRVIRNSTSGYDHDMYINYAAGGGSRTRIYSNNSQTILCEYNNVYMNSGGYTYTGQINCVFYSRSMTNTDYCCIGANTGYNTYTSAWLDVAYGSFTAFHRCYTDDELYNNETDESIDLFKNNYIGRVVIATGKIKTDSTRAKEPEPDKPKNEPTPQEWYSVIDKDGICIEDAIPIVQLSRKKKDKRVFGVLGEPTRNTNNKERLIVNSIGEGAICVSNTNGNIENGDYIQSSDLLGYGEKQDDDLLHNYTIAKSTIDCNFELDSPYYQCHEIENGVRVAFIACSYHCG